MGFPQGPAGTPAGDILDGLTAFVATTGASTIITIPAGRTWVGVVAIAVAVQNAAANAATGQATAAISIFGAGSSPAAGIYIRCTALAGANVAAGLVGDSGNNSLSVPMVISAPPTNVVQLLATATITGSSGEVNVSAIGVLEW